MTTRVTTMQNRSNENFSFGLRIGPKIIAGYLILIVLLAAVGGAAYWGIGRITNVYEWALEEETDSANLWAMHMYMDNQYGSQADLIINGDSTAVEDFRANAGLMDEKKEQVRDGIDTDEEKQLLAEIDNIDAQFDALFFEQVVPAWEAGDEQKLRELDGQSDELLAEMEEKTDQLNALFDRDVEEAQQNAQAVYQRTTLVIVVGSIVAAVVGLGFGFWLARSISGPVQKVAQAANQLANQDLPQLVHAIQATADGDLTATIELQPSYVDVRARDEVGQMAQAFNGMNASLRAVGDNFVRMLVNLRELVGQVQQSADQVASASIQLNASADQAGQAGQQVASTANQVAAGTAQQTQAVTEATGNVDQMARAAQGVARGSQEQAQGVQKTSDLIDEMDNIVEQVGRDTQAVTGATTKVTQTARQGADTVEQSSRGMDTIRTRTTEAVGKVKEMETRSKEIGRIVDTIDEIADKTDMLALNAAVEAARAGDYGRGFAVVAEQVRKLSEDSKSATGDIDQLIERVQQTVSEAIAAMMATATEVDNGSQLAANTSEALLEILQAAEEAGALAQKIVESVAGLKEKSGGVVSAMETVSAVVEENTATAEEMAANIQEVSDAMEGVAGIAEENSAATEEVSASAEEMSAQVEEVVASAEELSALAADLQALAQNFRLGEDENLADKIEVFKQAHLRWVDRLNDMVAGHLALQESQVESHYECILGRWYYLAGKQELGHLPEYIALEKPHAALHEAVRHVVASHNRGERKTAEAGIKDVRRYSHEVVNLLDQLERKTQQALYTHAPASSQPHPTPDRVLAPAGHQGNGYSD